MSSGWDAIELMLVGANAVQVGTATFADPRAAAKIAVEMTEWATSTGTGQLASITGRAFHHPNG